MKCSVIPPSRLEHLPRQAAGAPRRHGAVEDHEGDALGRAPRGGPVAPGKNEAKTLENLGKPLENDGKRWKNR